MRYTLSRRSGLLVCLALGMLSACDASKSPAAQSAPPSDISASYQELAGEFAACGEHLDQCLNDANDRVARLQCRTDFARCRQDAGKHAVQEMIAAIHACIDSAKRCKHAGDDDAGIAVSGHMCRKELWACIWHRGNQHDDEADAGSDDEDQDCIGRLHESLWAGHSASTCAGHVRECVADALPDPDDVVPDNDDEQGPSDHHQGNAGSSADSDADAGTAASAGSSGHGSSGGGAINHGRTCLLDYGICLRERRGVRVCVEGLRQCAHPAAH